MERATTTASSLDAEQDSDSGLRCQDTILGGVDAQTRFETVYKTVQESLYEELIDDRSPFWNEIEVNAGNSNLMLLALAAGLLTTVRHNIVLSVYVNAARHNLVLLVQVNDAEVLGNNKGKMVNGERQLHTLVDKNKTPITTQPSTSKPQKKQYRRKQNKATTVHQPSDSTADIPNEEFMPIHSNDPLISGEDRLKLTELMDMCTKLSERGRSDDAEMFDTDDLIGNEVFAENDMIEKDQDVIPKEVSTAAPSTTVIPPPSPVITESTTTIAPSIILKAKGITFRDAGESTTRTPTSLSSSSIKDKRKAKMDEPKVPLKKKDQIALGEEMARNLEAQIQAELIEEERIQGKRKMKPI
ncbi:hypothetical protein Tco_1140388 [Tanacetum coccineum]